MVLANILRTNVEAHRPLPQDSELLKSLRVLTRAQQDAAWDQITISNRIRTVATGLLCCRALRRSSAVGGISAGLAYRPDRPGRCADTCRRSGADRRRSGVDAARGWPAAWHHR